MRDLSARRRGEMLREEKTVIDPAFGYGDASRSDFLSTSYLSSSPHVSACALPAPKLGFSTTC
jgi:hypothetical protein